MNIKRIVFASLFCIAVLLCARKKAEAAFPYDMEQKPVTATSIQDGKVAVYSDENLKNKKEEVAGNKLTIEAYKVSKSGIYGNYKSGKSSGTGWFSLNTFVVNPKYKNVYATVRDHMYIYTNRSYSKVQTTIKKYSGVIVISKVDGDRQVICDKKDHYEIGWMTASAFSNTLLYDGREKQTLADGIYKLDYNDVLKRHIETGADITIVCKDMGSNADVSSYGVVTTYNNGRIIDFVEKPLNSTSTLVSTGIYVIRRRLLIQMLEECVAEDRYDIVNDIIIRNKESKKIYAYQLDSYWNNLSSIEKFYNVNMDFLKPEVRDFFFKQYPDVYSKVEDMPPAKYNSGSNVKNSLISSGCIVNGTVENSVVFKQAYIGNNCTIKNSVILNDVYIGDNAVIENCIVESHSTINPGDHLGEENEIKIINERNFRYSL